MRLKVFIGTTLGAVMMTSTLPAFAQNDPPPVGTTPASGTPAEPPAPPPNNPAPPEAVPRDLPPTNPAASEATPSATVSEGADVVVNPESDPMADTGIPTKIGETLSPLVVTAGLGYGYASITHPEIKSRSLSGAFLEVAVGTELERRFRLSLAFTSFETKIRRASGGGWEEGEFSTKVASGLRTLKEPVEPSTSQIGGVEVQKTFHAHSIGPRMDFFPLGSQGPYLGMTAAVAVIQDVSTRVGADLAARVGGEWRPLHSLGIAIEAGAHGQIYDDARAAIPYALARLSLMLEPPGMYNKGSGQTMLPSNFVMPRTLPPSTPR